MPAQTGWCWQRQVTRERLEWLGRQDLKVHKGSQGPQVHLDLREYQEYRGCKVLRPLWQDQQDQQDRRDRRVQQDRRD